MVCTSEVEIRGIEITKGRIVCLLTVFTPHKDSGKRIISETAVSLNPEEGTALREKLDDIKAEVENILEEYLTGVSSRTPEGITIGE
tara:strand:- start:130 stop:390 length:261 start_codon:yes stop_codon:yes gene_type:complete